MLNIKCKLNQEGCLGLSRGSETLAPPHKKPLTPHRTEDIYDFVYIDAFGKGKQLTAKECEYLIGHQVTADYYSAISTTEVLLRIVGNLLNIGKRG